MWLDATKFPVFIAAGIWRANIVDFDSMKKVVAHRGVVDSMARKACSLFRPREGRDSPDRRPTRRMATLPMALELEPIQDRMTQRNYASCRHCPGLEYGRPRTL